MRGLLFQIGLLALGDGGLSGGQAGDGYPEGGAGQLLPANLVPEHEGARGRAVPTAAAAVQDGGGGTAHLDCLFHDQPHHDLPHLGVGTLTLVSGLL